ncbi:heparinase II/III domain-containing protein [Clostridium baratii]|uniref:heparinase II/III domain-containing protein n=1 Tax=Clostridium baratii TaxID=1561 RepID=UPI0005F2ACC5|nr:heparinase II/III family protein [Clostridium baratii]AQM60684.1 hypothetical protein NPD11_2454 [Clostridium baratii]KJU72106.1 hypothetical protein UC77_05145 [Clostridium baratii]
MKLAKDCYDNIIRLTKINKYTLEIAENIINHNKYRVATNLEDIYFEEGNINWDYKHNINSNSYLLYLHSLSIVSYLVNAYEKEFKKKYLVKAKEIVESWMDYNENNSNNMIWYDHTTANRTHNLIYFFIISKDILSIDEEKMYRCISKHIEYLYNDCNYFNNNHGIMIDKALIMCSFIFEDIKAESWRIKGLSRLKETFYNSFSDNGVHLENSIYYHQFVKKLYIEIENFLNNYNITLGKEITKNFNKIEKYFTYACKPNNYLPLLGDTTLIYDKNIIKNFESFFDPQAGICILQNRHKEYDENSTWISFICGYFKKTHKHYDDLSFTMYSMGKDIFVDSGSFGYGRGKERRYVQHAKSHNTFMVNNENYKLLDELEAYNKIRLISFYENKYYSLVKGKNYAYPDVKLERTLILFRKDFLIIYDKGVSQKNKKYTQIFNLDPNVDIETISESECILRNEDIIIKINQLNKCDEIKINYPDINEPIAVISEKTGELTKTKQVEFSTESMKSEFITLISIDKSEENIEKLKFRNNDKIIEITVDGINHTICLE